MSAVKLLAQATKLVCEEAGEPWPEGTDAEFDDPNVVRLADAFAELVLTERAAELEREVALMRHRVDLLDRMDILDKALAEWINKTEWVRKTLQVPELGMHIADVMSARLKAALAEPAVEPDGWHLSKDGLPPVGAQVMGGHFYVDPWLKDKTPVFSWGLCRVLKTTHPEFKDGKQWQTFGPSHNDITHWCWPPAPPSNGNTAPPPPAEPEGSVCARCGGLVFDPVLVQPAAPIVQHVPADDTEGGAL